MGGLARPPARASTSDPQPHPHKLAMGQQRDLPMLPLFEPKQHLPRPLDHVEK